jgi:hypothetical protein
MIELISINIYRGTYMTFRAEIKSYDPDEEDSEDFATWHEAADWIKEQLNYSPTKSINMWINGDRVKHVKGVIYNIEPEDDNA